MLSTWMGSRLPAKYHRFLKLPERIPSRRIADTANTSLGQLRQRWLPLDAEESAVYRLDLGSDALSMRLALIAEAESSIDIQSYLVRDDLSGNLIVMELLRAAERGVRVRLLLDDALTKPVDPGLLAISAHPKIEVRVFNPFPRTRSRFVSFIANFNILNRRMHNKSFTVDHQATIVGGRNLADEYFQSSRLNEFLDEDLLAVGAAVAEVAASFDDYWNTRESMPIEALGRVDSENVTERLIQEGEQYIGNHDDAARLRHLDDARGSALSDQLPLIKAKAQLIVDQPHKVRRIVRPETSETTDFLRNMLAAATEEVVVVSPYFVPLRQGVEFFASLVKAGVRVVIVTNSLASTNHPSVHAVYARYRKPLLRAGVELYELRPRLGHPPDDPDTPRTVTLHSKVAVVDGERLFVGSYNLDPRSLYINTEMGMAVESETLASDMADSILGIIKQQCYTLELAPNAQLRWRYRDESDESIQSREPHTTFWRRFRTWLMSWLPIEGQM